MKPYYEDHLTTIYHADCSQELPDADVVITDPPYGFGAYESDVQASAGAMAYIARHYRSSAVFGYPENLVALCVALGRVPTEWIAWAPPTPFNSLGELLPRSSEHIAVFGAVIGAKRLRRERSKDGLRLARAQGLPDDARLGDVWLDSSPGRGFRHMDRLHPNQKPIEVMARLVLLLTDTNELVLDPFMGSGTTLLAAKQLGRRAIGIEIEERYCEVAAKRLSQETLGLSA